MGIAEVLGIIFVVLKLTDHIDWSWWWVTSPFWIAGICYVSVLAIATVVIYKTRSRMGW